MSADFCSSFEYKQNQSCFQSKSSIEPKSFVCHQISFLSTSTKYDFFSKLFQIKDILLNVGHVQILSTVKFLFKYNLAANYVWDRS